MTVISDRLTLAAGLACAGALLVAAPPAIDARMGGDPESVRSALQLVGVACLLATGGYWLVARLRVGADGRDSPKPEPLVAELPEAGSDQAEGLVGERLRKEIDRAALHVGLGKQSLPASSVRETVRDAAVAAEQHATGVTEAAARRAVARGEWTDDPVAAAFLAADDADCPYPMSHVVFDWAAPQAAFKRRVKRSATAIVERYETAAHSTGDSAAGIAVSPGDSDASSAAVSDPDRRTDSGRRAGSDPQTGARRSVNSGRQADSGRRAGSDVAAADGSGGAGAGGDGTPDDASEEVRR